MQAELLHGQTANDRPDQLARGQTKLTEVWKDLTDRLTCDQVQAPPFCRPQATHASASRAALIIMGVAEAGRCLCDRVPEVRPAARAHNELTGCLDCLGVRCSARPSYHSEYKNHMLNLYSI